MCCASYYHRRGTSILYFLRFLVYFTEMKRHINESSHHIHHYTANDSTTFHFYEKKSFLYSCRIKLRTIQGILDILFPLFLEWNCQQRYGCIYFTQSKTSALIPDAIRLAVLNDFRLRFFKHFFSFQDEFHIFSFTRNHLLPRFIIIFIIFSIENEPLAMADSPK